MTVRDPNAYVVTAKQCVAQLLSSPLSAGVAFAQLGLTINVGYGNGAVGSVTDLAWLGDDMILISSFATRPESYNRLCPACSMFADLGTAQHIPVSLPAPNSDTGAVIRGMVVTDNAGKYQIRFDDQTTSEISGAPIIDTQTGDLVGIVLVPPNGSGEEGQLSMGKVANDLTRLAVGTFEPK